MENRDRIGFNSKKCRWCGESFSAGKGDFYCSESCGKKYADWQSQLRQCRQCVYAERINGGSFNNSHMLICGYLFITGKMRNCDINPCEKFCKKVDEYD